MDWRLKLGLTMKERKPIYRETAKRYQKATKKEKREILNQFIKLTGLTRNHAATLLRNDGKKVKFRGRYVLLSDITKKMPRKGRNKKYDKTVLVPLIVIWKILGFICGKRLKVVIDFVIKNLKINGHLRITREVEKKLLEISPSSIDRLLKPERKRIELKGRNGTKPGTLLKQQIAVRTWAEWDENSPGYMEIDLVGHEGGNARGDFAQTLDMIDVFTGWTEQAAIKNKAAIWVKEAVERVRRRLPFDLLGLDSDTGAEFINHIMHDWCQINEIKFTRGRSSRSNDNCYVEQKNYSIVRQNVGYSRYDTDEEVYWLNRLYAYLRLFTNFFQPVMKMTERERIGSKVKKKHDDIKTPYQRVMDCGLLSEVQKERLKRLYKGLDLYWLRHEISRCQKRLWYIQQKKHGLEEDSEDIA